MACLDENVIDSFVAGTLGPDERRDVEKHLAECSECRTLVSTIVKDGTQPIAEPSITEIDRRPVFAFAVGDTVGGRYRIARILGRGGMGDVFEAEDLHLHTRIALKTIRGDVASPSMRDRFRREILLARKVTHPNVCRIFDLGIHEDVPFLTMELLDGRTLADLLRTRGKLPTREALPIVEQIARGLDAAHDAGVVHRDFKSQNVMLVPDRDAQGGARVVITDFGLARGDDVDETATTQMATKGIVGSPAYMAPEQVLGKNVSASSDVYAFGVVLYEMVTGKLPFVEATPLATAASRLTKEPERPRVDARWSRAILRCLSRDPDSRFARATLAVAALRASAGPPRAAIAAGLVVVALVTAGAVVRARRAKLVADEPPPRAQVASVEPPPIAPAAAGTATSVATAGASVETPPKKRSAAPRPARPPSSTSAHASAPEPPASAAPPADTSLIVDYPR